MIALRKLVRQDDVAVEDGLHLHGDGAEADVPFDQDL
jgi:hypothetical protein